MPELKTLNLAAPEIPPADGAVPRERPSEIAQGGLASARHSSRGFAIGIVLLLIAGLLIAGYVAHLRVREDGRAGATASDEVDRPQVFQGSTDNQLVLILAALVTIYIVLGILYESFVHPLTILSGLPSAGVGALLTLYAFGHDLNVIGIIGIVMLMGIVKKNAIMMVDFAIERRQGGSVAARAAIREACLLRFRPIMMTTMAAIVGTLPIAVGIGVGSELRRPLGLAVVGGLLLSQLLTLYITPVIYLYLDRFQDWASGRTSRSAVVTSFPAGAVRAPGE